MGPGDPFGARPRPPGRERPEPSTPPAAVGSSHVVWVGLVVGVAVGAVGWFEGFGAAVALSACGLVGMGLAWAGAGVVSGRLDWRAAWRALRGTDLR